MTDRYLIAIATCHRPTGLQRLLDSLETVACSTSLDVLVVDNDAKGSARLIALSHKLSPAYVIEPEVGIVAARNRALQHFSDRYRAIIFVDDDEWVSPNWLASLTDFAARTQADVVVGPVVSVFPETAPKWVQRGGFYERRYPENGESLPTAPTNNTLLVRDTWVGARSPRFDASFSATGGEDTDFFRGIRKSGAAILFCGDAVVYEEVPMERLSLRWVRRRAISNGLVDTRVRLKHRDSVFAGLIRAARSAVYGILFLGVGLITGRGLQARPYNSLFFAFGQFAALFNYRIEAYSRIVDPDDTH